MRDRNDCQRKDKAAEDIRNTARLGHSGVVGGHPYGTGDDSQDDGL